MNPTEEKALNLIEKSRDAARRALDKANELLLQLKALGETKEERALTLEAIEGLTPEQIREVAHREKDFLNLNTVKACLKCGGPLELRKFVDEWSTDPKTGANIPTDPVEELYCSNCKIRWIEWGGDGDMAPLPKEGA